MKYIQKTLFQSNKTGSGKFEYGRDIQLYPLKNHSEKKVYYDKELNMYFESAQSFNGYEIEIRDVSVDLDKEVRKAEDLHRRLQYKYDWLHVEKCSNGKITGIGNLEKLRIMGRQTKRTKRKAGKATQQTVNQ